MPARHVKWSSEVEVGSQRIGSRMETIWLQRSNPDLPWGFRMVGGQDFGLPLTIQKVTPGSVAAAALGPGDLILRVGNVMATNLAHNDAQELVRQAGNILQLTVKKPEGAVLEGQLSPSGYETQLSVQVNDYNAAPKGFGTGIPLNSPSYRGNSASPNYSTTPRNFGSQHQSPIVVKVDTINMTASVPQHARGYSLDDDLGESDGLNFPDYTLAYRKQDLVHDSPGGPDNIRGFVPPNEDDDGDYSSKSLPRGFAAYTNRDLDKFKEPVGPPAFDQDSQNVNSFNANLSVDVNFSTGVPIQSSPHTPQQIVVNPSPQQIIVKPTPKLTQSSSNSPHLTQSSSDSPHLTQSSSNSPHSTFNSAPRPFSPLLNSGSSSPRPQVSPVTIAPIIEPIMPTENYITPAATIEYGITSSDQSNVHVSGTNKYSTLPHTKPAYNTNNNVNNYSIYKGAPQPYSAPKPYAPTQTTAPLAPSNQSTLPFTTSQPKPFQSQVTPGMSTGFSSVQPVFRKVSFDHGSQESAANALPTNYTARPFKPLEYTATSTSPVPVTIPSTSQYVDNSEITVINADAVKPRSFSLQPSKSDELYTAVPFTVSAGPRSPRAVSTDRGGVSSSLSDGVNSISLESTRDQPTPPPVWATPLPPPPPVWATPLPPPPQVWATPIPPTPPVCETPLPPPPPVWATPLPTPPAACETPLPPPPVVWATPIPPPPPVWASPIPQPPSPPPPPPPINSSNPTSHRRPNYQQNDQPEEQKIPDQLLSAMLKSNGGGPKPFSYGLDLAELKKKMGPPTAPKPKPGQPNYQGQMDEPEVPRQHGGQQKKPAGQVQSDYFIKREDDADPKGKASRKPAGQVQADYFLSRQTGPRSEVDESPININMGADPKKQSKSFKVLQWMTETEQDEPEEPSQKPRRTKDPERRHNADDDEMRFSGLNSRTEIPSKTFGILQRISSNDESTETHNGKAMLDVGDAEDVKGNNGESYGRFKGATIPSPSFRLLQSWAEYDPDPNISVSKPSSKKDEDEELQAAINSEEMSDKRYQGGNIPSKVFKVLQQSLGEDNPNVSLQLNIKGPESEQPVPEDNALISDF